jgi:pyruvate/2-oxoglutarate dehydrogenase complex dihydrolipoamide acyltransferase (E2) component
MSNVTPLLVPQVNVNDETVLLVRWTVPQHARVNAGDTVCEVETTKATAEVVSDRAGVLFQSAEVGSRVRIGEVIGAIGPTREAVTDYASRAAARSSQRGAGGEIRATPKARALAEVHGVSLHAVASSVVGTVKEADVRQFVAGRQAPAPAGLAKYLVHEGALPAFDAAVAANLRQAASHSILTSVDMDCRLTAAHARIRSSLAAGRMVSLLPLVIAAVGRSLPRFPRLMSIAHDGELYRYRNVDVAFVARSADGRLYTPVIRSAGQIDVMAIASACQAAMLRVMRHALKADELEGACFTISYVPVARTARVVALPNAGQSAVLGVSAERLTLGLQNGGVVETPTVTLTLTYDHTICDGTYAAEFLSEVVADLERPGS